MAPAVRRTGRGSGFAADRLGIEASGRAVYAGRKQSRYEHVWEIRDAFGYREFGEAEPDARA
ncbi:DUF4158 domain-containing protein [Streptomyces eurythermus]|uniref:DUF4158 domain-containing protein n=1 Tax=Streptomyces eurythermus TaxID=42237 RepID=UPI00368619C6